MRKPDYLEYEACCTKCSMNVCSSDKNHVISKGTEHTKVTGHTVHIYKQSRECKYMSTSDPSIAGGVRVATV